MKFLVGAFVALALLCSSISFAALSKKTFNYEVEIAMALTDLPRFSQVLLGMSLASGQMVRVKQLTVQTNPAENSCDLFVSAKVITQNRSQIISPMNSAYSITGPCPSFSFGSVETK